MITDVWLWAKRGVKAQVVPRTPKVYDDDYNDSYDDNDCNDNDDDEKLKYTYI